MSSPVTLAAPADVSRRSVLRRGAVVGGTGAAAVAATTVGAAPARAAGYRPRRSRSGPLLSPAGRHLVGRFSYGHSPALTRQVIAAGGPRRWFEKQLDPGAVPDGAAAGVRAWWPSLQYDAGTIWKRNKDGVMGGWEVMEDYQRWLLVRRVRTNRQVHELMTEFWMNHLNVPCDADGVYTWRVDYDRVVRRHALGKFSDLLAATTTHPAMGMYLSNAVSTKRHPNENLGRELLELHTVGRGNYTEDDVKNSARILTGYRVDMWRTFDSWYSPDDHWTGPVQVMDFTHDNAAADGRAVTADYLRYLATHPQTAQRIARKLVVKFVRDDAPQGLVDRLAAVYLRNDTAIAPVLRALVRSPEFAASAGAKVRDPGEDVVATYRALGVVLHRPPDRNTGHAAHAILWQTESVGARPCSWPRPDGPPLTNAAWSAPGRLLASMELHWSMSGGWWPRDGITYRRPARWLPKRAVRFDVLVDHMSVLLLGKRSTANLLKACCQACQTRPGEVITARHGLVRWNFHRLISTMLDSPAHLTR